MVKRGRTTFCTGLGARGARVGRSVASTLFAFLSSLVTSDKITLKPEGEADIPLLLALPPKREGPVPLVILLHGLGGRKKQLIDLYARRLAEKGIASAAFDLDGHGDRKTPSNDFSKKLRSRNLLAVGLAISRSVVDGRRVIDYAATRAELDVGNTAVLGRGGGIRASGDVTLTRHMEKMTNVFSAMPSSSSRFRFNSTSTESRPNLL